MELSTEDDVAAHERGDAAADGIPAADSTLPAFARVIRQTRWHLAARHLGDAAAAADAAARWLPCHAIDLAADGALDAHVDSVKFSGGLVAGLSLLSDAIMRLRPAGGEWHAEAGERGEARREEEGGGGGREEAPDDDGGITAGHVDLYLPRRSLYVLTGPSRYSYTHELRPSGSMFAFGNDAADDGPHREEGGGEPCVSGGTAGGEAVVVERGRRLSVIFRDARQDNDA